MRRQALDVAGRHALEERRRAGPREVVLHHVADVEERRGAAGEQVRVQHREVRVLHRHRVVGEGDHGRAVANVEVVEGGLVELFGRGRGRGIARAGLRGYACD